MTPAISRTRHAAAIAVTVVAAVLVQGTHADAAPETEVGLQIGLRAGSGGASVRFVGIVSPLPVGLERQMRGTTWRPGCPVPLVGLRLLTLSYWGFDERSHVGPMVVNASVANDIVWVFRQLFDHRFPIHVLKLARRFRPKQAEHDTPGDPTASFNCRPVVTPLGPSDTISQHSYGLAIDIDPIENPFVVDGYVRNRYSRPYRDRSQHLPGMIHEGDIVVRSFAAIGWSWGGDWSSGQDYMHFSSTGK